MKLTKRDVGIGLLAGIAGYVIAKKNLIDIQIVRDSSRKSSGRVRKDRRKHVKTGYSYGVWCDSREKARAILNELRNIACDDGIVSTSEWREICFDNDDGNKPLSKLNSIEIGPDYGWYGRDLEDTKIYPREKQFDGVDGWELTLPPAREF